MSDLQQESPKEHSTTPSDPQDKPEEQLVLEGYLSKEQLARQLCLSPRTIDRWEALRKGPPRVCIGRTILYSIHSVREWLASHESQAAPAKRQRNFASVRP
jgi:predicted DNA-binding transcriptional regulator AlpA